MTDSRFIPTIFILVLVLILVLMVFRRIVEYFWRFGAESKVEKLVNDDRYEEAIQLLQTERVVKGADAGAAQ